MTDLVLVRHGEMMWHGENRYAGVSEVELSPRGLRQAAQLATWASSAGLCAVWSSPLGRALGTATPCADLAGLRLQVDARLRELDFGAGEGRTPEEMRERFPAAFAAFCIDPVADHLPGGEDPVAAVERVVTCLHDIADVHPQGRVLVVSHSTVIRLALCQLLGAPLRDYRQLFPTVRNCALTEIRMTGRRPALLRFNVPLELD
ncbi:MAG: histidine phosphatase family protein [Candidatus Limnocylindrales bacterium]|jgi:probable phosphoglycerate mutase